MSTKEQRGCKDTKKQRNSQNNWKCAARYEWASWDGSRGTRSCVIADCGAGRVGPGLCRQSVGGGQIGPHFLIPCLRLPNPSPRIPVLILISRYLAPQGTLSRKVPCLTRYHCQTLSRCKRIERLFRGGAFSRRQTVKMGWKIQMKGQKNRKRSKIGPICVLEFIRPVSVWGCADCRS